jgi:predicted metal-binding protein
MPVKLVVPVIDNSVRELCPKPYPNHPKGCPNWGKRDTCPPRARLLFDILDETKPVYCVYNVFDFGSHTAKMRALHPEWSQRQVDCCLYWQGTARKQLKKILAEALRDHPGTTAVACPEACGVNVTATMKSLGVELEWPPKTVTYQVALIGEPERA